MFHDIRHAADCMLHLKHKGSSPNIVLVEYICVDRHK